MRTVGDPSFIPPTKFRYLQNVRLGAGDVKSRPGLAAFDTLTAPAIWLTEVHEEVQSATIYFGPGSRWDQLNYASPTSDTMNTNYSRHDFSRIPPGTINPDDKHQASTLFGLFPIWERLILTDGWLTFSMACNPSPYIASDYSASSGPPVLTTWAAIEPFSGIPSLGFFQNAACVDPLVKWRDREGNDRWLCAGQHRGDIFSGVGDYEVPYYTVGPVFNAAVGDPTLGGQPIFEVNFDTKGPIDRLVLLGFATDLFITTPLFPGGLTEVFRMPPPGYKEGCRTLLAPVPTASYDPAMYPEGQWVRSMVSVPRRADDVLTGEEITEETLYIGTVGGKAIATDGTLGAAPDPTVKWGRNDPSDGAVWSYDGITLEEQLDAAVSPAGQCVLVAKTGDGGVIAAGRDRAAFLPEKGAAWVSVAYVPGFTVPPSTTNNLFAFDFGYFWTSRAEFQGQVYFYGYDIGAGYDPGPAPPEGPNVSQPARLVIARFDPGALTITVIRTGAAFSQSVVNAKTLGMASYEKVGNIECDPVLASTGNRLFYLSRWSPAAPDAFTTYVGEYDGVTFDDDKYGWPNAGDPGAPEPTDMVASQQLLWLASVPNDTWKIQNGVIVYMVSANGSAKPASRIFVGP